MYKLGFREMCGCVIEVDCNVFDVTYLRPGRLAVLESWLPHTYVRTSSHGSSATPLSRHTQLTCCLRDASTSCLSFFSCALVATRPSTYTTRFASRSNRLSMTGYWTGKSTLVQHVKYISTSAYRYTIQPLNSCNNDGGASSVMHLRT